jgi:hypothetical protein
VAAVRSLLPLDGITILISTGTETVIPELGIGGRDDPGHHPNGLRRGFAGSRSFAGEGALSVASARDAPRFPVGFSSNLLEAMMTEGLADQFSVEVAGIDPPLWSSALSGEGLETWSLRARAEWFNRSYNHDAWFFGAAPPIPRWAGYTIGFELVGEFLRSHPSRRPSDLFAEPAGAFIRE